MTPSVCLIVGDNHNEHCGVKDYANQLGRALEERNLSVEVSAPADWGPNSLLRFRKDLRRRNFDILHVQYPSVGHRKSLGPHIIGLMSGAKGVVVTLHDYSALPASQRASMHLFRWTADQLLFTTEMELNNYGRSNVTRRFIHIGSSVPAFPGDKPRTAAVLYFGLIRPEKGLEEFLELARRGLQCTKAVKYQVIGSVPQRREDYYKTVRATAAPEVQWLIDLSFEQVARLMAGSLAAYLPFPDGASYRRSSLLAALTNGVPTITTISTKTPPELMGVLLPATGPDDALAHIERLLCSPDEVNTLDRAGRRLAEKFSWTEIARQHEEVYHETLSLASGLRRGMQKQNA